MTRTVRVDLHTNGTTTPIFVPAFTARVNEVGSWRASFILEGGSSTITSGDYTGFQVQGAYRSSDDDVSWSGKGVTGLGSAVSTAGVWQYGSAYTSTPAGDQLVQIGFNVSNKVGNTNINKVTATLRVDLRAP